MLSPTTVILLFLLAGELDHSAVVAQGVPDEPGNTRSPNGIYANTLTTSEGSPFQRNVEAVVQFFLEHNPPNGFATCLGYGNPDTVYGHTACYNMSDQPSCSSCIQQAYNTIQQRFPRTIGATFWINETALRCRLRYENYNITGLTLLGIVGPNGSATVAPVSPPAPLQSAPPPTSPPSSSSSSNGALVWGLVGGGLGLVSLLGIAGCLVWRKKLRKRLRSGGGGHDTELEGSFEGPAVFKYHDLSVATGNFSERNKLGQGGFGTVYKASLKDGTQVAVKKLSLQSSQGKKEFVNEINIITSIQHRNLVRLKGYCVEKTERLLVYEFLNNGSLDQALFGSKASILSWQSRFQIAIGVARGLAYLHEESHVQIIHRDIKASNILLEDKLQPKISDFGVSKLFDVENSFTSTKVAGTLGYMAPEYATRGRLTAKADVFSYGVLVLEIVSGRKCVDPTLPEEEQLLMQLVWKLCQAWKMDQCIDERLGDAYVAEEMYRLVRVALLCTQDQEEARPAMSDVVAMLLGYLEIGGLPMETPRYFSRIGTPSTTSSSGGPITEVTAR